MDVLILFAVLFAVAALVIAVLARRPGPTPASARGSEPGARSGPERTLDRPAGPGAESEAVPAPGEIGPAHDRDAAARPPGTG